MTITRKRNFKDNNPYIDALGYGVFMLSFFVHSFSFITKLDTLNIEVEISFFISCPSWHDGLALSVLHGFL